jgi:hypothetical protein
MSRKLIALLAAVGVLVGLASPAAADPQGYIEDDFGVGYFYGTFGQNPNVILLAGGTADEFCEANPDDPFNGEPGMASVRLFLRQDGSVDLKVNDKDQPIFLYYNEFDDGPIWIEDVCEAYFADGLVPAPFASGMADLKVRISVISEDLVDVFNSVNGKAVGTDGREYKVFASADLIVENGVPVGNPEDFVSFELNEIRR